jgi:hypothetical protein
MINQRLKTKYLNSLRPKINYENRNRDQIISIVYNNMNLLSYFNYFSLDLIEIITILKYFIKKKYIKNNNNFNLEIIKLLIQNNLNKKELNFLLSELIKNSFIKFKNPIITLDILLFTYLDNEKIINKNNFNSNFIRYKILQKIYIDKNKLIKFDKNIQIFILLLKTQISNLELKQLDKNSNLYSFIFIFRNLLLNKIELIKFEFNNVKKIISFIFLTNKRKY